VPPFCCQRGAPDGEHSVRTVGGVFTIRTRNPCRICRSVPKTTAGQARGGEQGKRVPACVGAIPADHHSHASASATYPLFTLSAKRTQRPGDCGATRGNSPAGAGEFGSFSRWLRRSVISDRTGATSLQTREPVASYAWLSRQRLRAALKRAVASAFTPRR